MSIASRIARLVASQAAEPLSLPLCPDCPPWGWQTLDSRDGDDLDAPRACASCGRSIRLAIVMRPKVGERCPSHRASHN